ncbi:hypothetical protein [Enterococcus faecium]|uniref:hypothetical protein n=1 Tax=Enterococcus faecium TaxID=1352 RepID=UPI0020918A7F|nr:hypothetical protein [Enterococcus faecium]MCO5462219.1 hypothetical protein [Enterococcus faecium]
MNFLKNLFKKEKQQKEEFHTKHPSNEVLFSDEWEAVPEYIPTSSENNEIVSVNSAAIVANDQPKSRFVVRSIQERNPEAVLVSMIATSIVAGEKEKSQFIVRKIMRKKEK